MEGSSINGFNGNFLYLYGGKDKNGSDIWDAFPLKYMQKESYVGALEVQDIDSTRNANGVLKREVLDHTAYTITFNTPPCYNTDMNYIFAGFINKHYLESAHKNERKLKVKFYVNEKDEYDTGDFYMATPKFTVNWVKTKEKKIFYNAVTISLIQY